MLGAYVCMQIITMDRDPVVNIELLEVLSVGFLFLSTWDVAILLNTLFH